MTTVHPGMSGSRREFGRALAAIEAKVTELSAMVTEDLPTATQALFGGHGNEARLLAEREQVIDALYQEVEGLVGRELLLQAPVASDLWPWS